MSIDLPISKEAEQLLRDAWGDGLGQTAFEALVIEGYRCGKFGSATVRKLLNHESRWVTERWLAERGVCANYSLEDLQADRRTLDAILPKTA